LEKEQEADLKRERMLKSILTPVAQIPSRHEMFLTEQQEDRPCQNFLLDKKNSFDKRKLKFLKNPFDPFGQKKGKVAMSRTTFRTGSFLPQTES